MSETPLKGKGGRLKTQAGWESWKTTQGVHRSNDFDRQQKIFSPLSGGPSDSVQQKDSRDNGTASGGDSLHRSGFVVPSLVPHAKVNGLFSFLQRELQWGHAHTWRSRSGTSEHVMNFFRVTLSLEPFLNFGHLLCIDLFLFHFTLLPLRCVFALWRLGCAAVAAVRGRVMGWLGGGEKGAPGSGEDGGFINFSQAHAYDLIKGAIFITATSALGAVQVSRVYHYIRGEAIIKLYVIFNILEIFDKLACSLGQDVMDGLYRTTRDRLSQVFVQGEGRESRQRRHRALFQLFFHFIVAVLYVVAHAVVLFVQIVCLNVAINSRNNALFTLLISNNFMELKASVFKKFEAENLFQVACSDAVERFQLVLFLVLIGVQELTSFSAATALLPSMLSIFACELLVDYVKHAFISKFNRLHSDLYRTFTAILAHDLIAVRARMPLSLDPTHSAVKRLGLATLPLAVVAHRMLLLRFAPDLSPVGGFPLGGVGVGGAAGSAAAGAAMAGAAGVGEMVVEDEEGVVVEFGGGDKVIEAVMDAASGVLGLGGGVGGGATGGGIDLGLGGGVGGGATSTSLFASTTPSSSPSSLSSFSSPPSSSSFSSSSASSSSFSTSPLPFLSPSHFTLSSLTSSLRSAFTFTLPSLHTLYLGALIFLSLLALKSALSMLLLSYAATTVRDQKRESERLLEESKARMPATQGGGTQRSDATNNSSFPTSATKLPPPPGRPDRDGPISFTLHSVSRSSSSSSSSSNSSSKSSREGGEGSSASGIGVVEEEEEEEEGEKEKEKEEKEEGKGEEACDGEEAEGVFEGEEEEGGDGDSVDSADSVRPERSPHDMIFGKGTMGGDAFSKLGGTSRYLIVKGRIPL